MSNCVTLVDHAARFGQGEEAFKKIIELQTKTNKVLEVLPFKACNDGTKEKAAIRTALPDVAWRMINKGITPSKSASKQVSFTTGHLQALAKVDEELIELNGGAASATGQAFRLSENAAFLEKMNQEMASTFFFGDEKKNPAGFTGLGAYYYSMTSNSVPAIYKERVLSNAGTGNALTSMWFCCFAEDTVYGLYPQGTKAGFGYKDNGRTKVVDASGGEYYAYESQYDWSAGLAVKDPRFVVRLANIDALTMTSTEDACTALMDNMIKAFNRIENPSKGKMAIFCNRDVMTYLEIAAIRAKNIRLTTKDFGGQEVLSFRGVPILRCDALTNTESAVQ